MGCSERLQKSHATMLRNYQSARKGETHITNEGFTATIIKYNCSTDVDIQFDDEFNTVIKCRYGNLVTGTVKNPNNRTLCGRGYVGIGEYQPTKNKKPNPAYDAWRKMFERCYREEYLQAEPSYRGCYVCEEWENYQVFAKWYYERFHLINGEKPQLDKDWIVYGNKVYSPDTCELVPRQINTCILGKGNASESTTLGAVKTRYGSYQPQIAMYGKIQYIGTFSTKEEAMRAYYNAKVNYIHTLANKYKDDISDRLYNVMMHYEERFLLENPEYRSLICGD